MKVEKCFYVSLKSGIIPVYKFDNGSVMKIDCYNTRPWESYFREYEMSDWYIVEYGVESKIVKTIKQAEKFIYKQKLKVIKEKQKEVNKLIKELQ